jgi:hypothetical protein
VPHQLSGLVNLEVLNVSSNWLTGSLPLSINTTTLPRLERFSAEGNQFDGPVPTAGADTTMACDARLSSPYITDTVVSEA